jgi:hypothetical protein
MIQGLSSKQSYSENSHSFNRYHDDFDTGKGSQKDKKRHLYIPPDNEKERSDTPEHSQTLHLTLPIKEIQTTVSKGDLKVNLENQINYIKELGTYFHKNASQEKFNDILSLFISALKKTKNPTIQEHLITAILNINAYKDSLDNQKKTLICLAQTIIQNNVILKTDLNKGHTYFESEDLASIQIFLIKQCKIFMSTISSSNKLLKLILRPIKTSLYLTHVGIRRSAHDYIHTLVQYHIKNKINNIENMQFLLTTLEEIKHISKKDIHQAKQIREDITKLSYYFESHY